MIDTPAQVVAPPTGTDAAATARRRSERELFAPKRFGRVCAQVALVVASLITLLPFYIMLVLSLKPQQALVLPGSLLPTHLTLGAYHDVLASSSMLRWATNTLIYSVVGVLLVLFLASLAGYAFAKCRFPGRDALFWVMLSSIMIPYQITLIPVFLLVAKAGGANTYWGLILPTLANTQAVFLMRQFIKSIPDELVQAARVDGASDLRIYAQIVMPLCKPILGTLGIFVFLWHWNDFLWPLIISQDSSMFTLTTGIASLHQQLVPLPVQLAGTVIAFVPIFIAYLFGQRYMREGLTMTGLKG